MSTEHYKQNVELQQTNKELDSTSTVKTPLVDALRSFFQKELCVENEMALGVE